MGIDVDGLGADGVYRANITGVGNESAHPELDRIEQLLRSPSGVGLSRAGLYNDLVLDRFRDLSASEQRAVLAVLDNYANALHDTNELVRTGLAPGSVEARRADLAVRIAADFARQSGAIDENAKFPADARAGMETGLAVMIGAVAGRGRVNEVGYGPPRQGLKIPQGLSPAAFDRISGTVRGVVDRMGLGDDVFVMGSRAGGTASAGSDLDIGIRVPSSQFDSLIDVYFSGARNARAETMRYAIRDGRIQAGEARLSRLSRQVASELGIPSRNVQISIIRAGGAFDNGPQSPLSYTFKK